jgi:uncharacterized membrane protein YdjX (TVP38/TMEM64 family)
MPKHKYILLIILLLMIIMLYIAGTKTGFNPQVLHANIEKMGIFAPLAFILLYTLAPVIFIPITPLSIAGGALFGQYWGTLFSVCGATLGASVSFLVSRYVLKEYVSAKTPSQLVLIQNSLEQQGWKFVCFARIMPFIPFNLQNYFFGVSKIRFVTFVWASAVSLIPGTFLYVYIGSAGQDLLSGNTEVINNIILSFALLIIISIVPYLIYKVKKKQSV